MKAQSSAAQEVVKYVQTANLIITMMQDRLDKQANTIADLFNRLATLEERVKSLESG